MPARNPNRSGKNAVQKLRFSHSTGKTSPIELIRLEDLRERDPGIYNPTRLDFHLVQVVTKGRGHHWVDFERVKLGRGDLLHIKPSQVHAFDEKSRHHALLLLFLPEAIPDPDTLEPLNIHLDGPLRSKRSDFDLLLGILENYESQQATRGAINPERLAPYCLGAFVTAIGDLLTGPERRQTSSRRSEQLVYDFERLIREHHAAHRDLAWYVPRLHVTGRTLARACHDVKGQSPKKIIDHAIALEAKRLLILTTETVEGIAFVLGFSEATNFVKFFKRIAGQTPELFRLSRPH